MMARCHMAFPGLADRLEGPVPLLFEGRATGTKEDSGVAHYAGPMQRLLPEGRQLASTVVGTPELHARGCRRHPLWAPVRVVWGLTRIAGCWERTPKDVSMAASHG